MIYGLIIRAPYIDWILSREKTWEIRGIATARRGPIALIKAGTKSIVGFSNLVEVIGPLTLEQYIAARTYHNDELEIGKQGGLPYPKTFAWVLSDVVRLDLPIPYFHPPGAITWVKLMNVDIPLELKHGRD